jgi:hypothetical protein
MKPLHKAKKATPYVSLRCVSSLGAITLFTSLEAALAKSLCMEGVPILCFFLSGTRGISEDQTKGLRVDALTIKLSPLTSYEDRAAF